MSDVLVLAYHAVSPTWKAALSVTPETLEAQLTRLVNRGWHGATFTEAVLRPPYQRTLAVTFDDAFKSVLVWAQPILARLGLRATVFVPTAFMSRRQPLLWPGIDDWLDTEFASELEGMCWEDLPTLVLQGWEIGSHTCTHPKLTRLTTRRPAMNSSDPAWMSKSTWVERVRRWPTRTATSISESPRLPVPRAIRRRADCREVSDPPACCCGLASASTKGTRCGAFGLRRTLPAVGSARPARGAITPEQAHQTYCELGGDYFQRRAPEQATKRLVAKLQQLGNPVTLQPDTADPKVISHQDDPREPCTVSRSTSARTVSRSSGGSSRKCSRSPRSASWRSRW